MIRWVIRLNVEPIGKVIDNINFGGDATNKLFAINSSLARSFEAAVDVSKSLDVSHEHPASAYSVFNVL